MQAITIYHNPQCSKSRKALEILQNHPLQLSVVDYLKTPLSLAQLEEFTKHLSLAELIRTEDALNKGFHLLLDNPQQILALLQKEPWLMQRPIVSTSTRTIIARPPERVLELLEV